MREGGWPETSSTFADLGASAQVEQACVKSQPIYYAQKRPTNDDDSVSCSHLDTPL
jgi:hypothetical protein